MKTIETRTRARSIKENECTTTRSRVGFGLEGYYMELHGISLPSNSNVELGLKQPFVVFQCKLVDNTPLNFEIVVKSTKGDQLRILMTSAFSEYKSTNFHLQIPLNRGVPRNVRVLVM